MLKKLKLKFIITCMSLVTAVLLSVFCAVLFSTYHTSIDEIYDNLKQANMIFDIASGKNPEDSFHKDIATSQNFDSPPSNKPNYTAKVSASIMPDSTDIISPSTMPDSTAKTDAIINSPQKNTDNYEKNYNTFAEYNPPIIGRKHDSNTNTYYSTVTVILNENNDITETFESNASMDETTLEVAVSQVQSNNTSKGLLSHIGLFYLKQTNSNGTIISFADSSTFENTMQNTIFRSLIIGFFGLLALFVISIFLAKMSLKPVEYAWNQQQQFVADASHELKTPLTVILANNNILQKHSDDTIENQKKWIDSTYEESIHMKKLVDDLLFLAKSDAGQTKTVLTKVDFSELTWSTLLQFEPVAFEKAIIIDSDIASDTFVLGDSTQLKQLIHILLDNACKYSQSGSNIFLKLTRHQHYAILSVTNSGTVISSDDLDHLFERFYRSDKARQREGGSGLGLSIAKSIIDEHNGTIIVESNASIGTTFTIQLDIYKE